MEDESRTTEEHLVKDLTEARRRVAELETDRAERSAAEKSVRHLSAVLRAIRKVNQLITHEKDRDRLLQGACDNLVETRGYSNTWIALLDDAGELITTAETGLGKDFMPMIERFERGEPPDCGRRALAQPEVVTTADPVSTCTDCPLAGKNGGGSCFTTRLEHEGKVYGLLSTSIPADFVSDEELSLFHEVADDIAFALYSIELDEQRTQAEERVRHLNMVLRAVRKVNQLITQEKSRDRLLQGACDCLIETRGYQDAWITVLDETGRLVTSAQAGLDSEFAALVEMLERGEPPDCGRRALAQPEVVVTADPVSTCTDCPLAGKYAHGSAATTRLEHQGRVYGLLSTSIPADFVSDEELSLFHEVADDIAFALHSIETEEARKRTEEHLRKHREHLEELVEERTSELANRVSEVEQLNRGMANLLEDLRVSNETLELTTQQLAAANKELEAFAYSVSHDLRAPLRAIDGFSRILKDEYGDVLDAEGKRQLAVIRDSTRDMAQLIDDLLAFSRLGRTEMKMATVNMDELARRVVEDLRHEVRGRHVQLNVDTLPATAGDRAMIRQVFANLLSNAIKFTRTREDAVIEVGAMVDGSQNTYFVKDNGVGFDMKYADKLFQVFQRLHSTDEFEGTGIGLALVQRIITRHGGRVWAEGEVDKGATFYFALPVISDQ